MMPEWCIGDLGTAALRCGISGKHQPGAVGSRS